jgi:protein involved in polysaccharide export with SLBB domain
MSSLLTTIREFLGPPDPRTEREIEDDIDAEFAFHIERIEHELIEQGVPREHAADLARARFGNQTKLKLRCKRIALEERIMLQKINFVLMIVVLLAVAVVAIQSILSQRANHEALAAIGERLDQMSGVMMNAPPPSERARVLVEGEIEQPGWYSIELDGATYIVDVIQQAGGIEPHHEVRRIRPTRDGRSSVSQTYTYDALFGEQAQRVVLRPNDEIRVVTPQDRPRSPSLVPRYAPESGNWQQVNRDGQPIPNGYTLSVLGSDDVRNLQSVPIGTLNLSDHEAELTLQFQQTSRQLIIDDHTGYRSNGRWQLDDGVLALNVRPAVEAIIEPLLFRHVDDLVGDEVEPTNRDAADARILIEGDIERPGWFPIRLDEATYVHDLLRRAGVHERQWVLHRPGGEGGQYELADLYLGDDPRRVVIRPGDEIQVADRRGPRTRGRFFLANAERYLFPYQWRQADENGELVEDGWRVDVSGWHTLGYGRNQVAHGSLIHSNGENVYDIRIAETSGVIEIGEGRPEQMPLSVTINVESIQLEVQEWRPPPRTARDEVEQMRGQSEALYAEIGFPDKITFVRVARQ